jgi:hypothetical protein
MAQRNQRGMKTVRAPVFRLERLNLTVPQIEFDWLDGVFKRELGRLHRAGLPAAGSHQLLLTHHNRLSGPIGLIRQSKYLFRLKEAADRVEPERD